MPQTSVASRIDARVEGQLADNTLRKNCAGVVSEEASAEIAPGRMLAQGASDDGVLLMATNTDQMKGVSVYDHAVGPESVGDTGFLPAISFSLLTNGRISVVAEDVVGPDSEVHVRTQDGQGGAALVVADFVFTAEADTEIFTAVNHGLLTGDGPFQVSNSGGALPTGISAVTDYWIIKIDADNFYLATTRALAQAGTHLSITTDGTGTQTMADTASTERIVDGKAGGFRGTADGEPLVVADLVFTAEADDEKFTSTAHGLQTGDGPVQVSNSGGALPAGLTAATNYWVIRFDANVFYLATTRANALAGTHLLISTDGTGTQTLSDTVDTERVTTVNVSSFCRWRGGTVLPGEMTSVEVKMVNAALATVG